MFTFTFNHLADAFIQSDVQMRRTIEAIRPWREQQYTSAMTSLFIYKSEVLLQCMANFKCILCIFKIQNTVFVFKYIFPHSILYLYLNTFFHTVFCIFILNTFWLFVPISDCRSSMPRRFVFYKVPPSDKRSLLWLANWHSALWLAEHVTPLSIIASFSFQK